MKIKSLFKAPLLLTAMLFVACNNTETAQSDMTPNQEETKGMTEFAVAEDAEGPRKANATRTSGQYTGHSIKFYWTPNDRLWINNPAAAPTPKVSSRSNIPSTGKTETAKFWFDGVYAADTYPVRYTGNGNNTGDKVTIKTEQTQQNANDGAHIGTDGDCGTATAHRQTDGSYKFTLDHKAAYLTFAPFYSKDALDNTVTIKKIKVTANENLAGTFDFNDNGIQKANVASPSKSITLTLNGTFNIPTASDYQKNGAIMVIAPGTYTNFTVEYTLADSKTGVSGTVAKTYPNVTFNAGANTPVKYNLDLTRYDMKYYMWDAIQDYWNGYLGTLPTVNDEQAPFDATGTNRYFNSNSSSFHAVNACATCPNANEATLYAFRGDPHWDETTPWVMNKHLYIGGMWFKKLQYIGSGYHSPVQTYPDGTDYRQNDTWKDWDEHDTAKYHDYWTRAPFQGKPTNTSQYFFLPAMGYIDNYNSQGQLKLGASTYAGAYWTSTGVVNNNGSQRAVTFHFSKTEVGLDVDNRAWGYPIFSVK